MKKNLILPLILSFTFIVSAQEISQQQLEEIKTTGFLENTIPDTEYCTKACESWYLKDKPSFNKSKLFYVDKAVTQEKLSKTFRSISSMEGLQYYSKTDKKWEVLYHKAYCIKSPEDKTKIPDKIEGSADGLSLYCLQEDNSLGNCVYRVNYSEKENEIYANFILVEPIKIGPIVAITKENLQLNIVGIRKENYCLIYLNIQSNFPKFSLIEQRLNNSLNSRIDALNSWLTAQLSE